MVIIKVWCLPADTTEDELKELFDFILAAAKRVRELKVRSERDILVLFPADMMKYGLGTEILIEVYPLDLPKNGLAACSDLQRGIRIIIEKKFPKARCICVSPAGIGDLVSG